MLHITGCRGAQHPIHFSCAPARSHTITTRASEQAESEHPDNNTQRGNKATTSNKATTTPHLPPPAISRSEAPQTVGGRPVRRSSVSCARLGHTPPSAPSPLQVTSKNVSRSRWQTTIWLSVDRYWQPCSAVTATRDVAWRATIDAGRFVPHASRIGTLGAPSCCVEIEHSLLGELLDEQPTWRLSTPQPN